MSTGVLAAPVSLGVRVCCGAWQPFLRFMPWNGSAGPGSASGMVGYGTMVWYGPTAVSTVVVGSASAADAIVLAGDGYISKRTRASCEGAGWNSMRWPWCGDGVADSVA